jgi:hypothetical protein
MGRDPFLFDPLSSHHQVSKFSIRTGSKGSASGKPQHLGIKVKLCLQSPFDVGRLAKAVLLSLEGHIGHWDPFGPQRCHHPLCLIGGHDGVFQALKEDNRTIEAL